MVGVPGRSKGCNTCIQRKIRCDQETPLCGNCRKSRRLCTGYKRRLGYVLSRDVSLSTPVEAGRDETTFIHQGRWRRSTQQQMAVAAYQVAETQKSWVDSTPSLSLCRHISADTALQQQFHYIFLNAHMPAEMLDVKHRNIWVPMDWILRLQDIVIQSPALESSISAYLAARVGRKNNDLSLVHQSRSMYVTSMERVRRALGNPQTRLSDETLAACVALSLYELTEHPAGARNAFFAHNSGAMMLLRLRGPDACASPLGHSLFLQLRVQTMVGSLVGRCETFLSQPEWMERPWKSVPKTPLDELNDAMFEMPTIYRQFDELSHETDLTVLQDVLHDVTAKFFKIESTLRTIYCNFGKSVSGPLYWPELSTLESPLDDAKLGKVFPVSFHFPAFFVGSVVTTYWSAMMAVHYQLMYTFEKLAAIEPLATVMGSHWRPTAAENSPRAVPFDQRAREHGEKWAAMVRNCCQSAEYNLQDKMGELGSLSALTTLAGCLSCLTSDPERWSREISWITDQIGRIKKKCNLLVGNPLNGWKAVVQSRGETLGSLSGKAEVE